MSSRWLGGWSLSKTTFEIIRAILPEGKIVLEFGSGAGTKELAKHYIMHSIESNQKYMDMHDSTYIYAPIVLYDENYPAPEGLPGKNTSEQRGWYDYKEIVEHMPEKYDLIFVDGPTERIGRGGFLKHIDLFDTSVPIIIDDVKRAGGRALLEQVSKEVGRDYEIKGEAGVIL